MQTKLSPYKKWKASLTEEEYVEYRRKRAVARAAWKETESGAKSIRKGKKLDYQKKKSFIDSFKIECRVCGEQEKCCLQFHHKDPLQKDGNVNSHSSGSYKKIELEIKKCVVVCANCHCKIHAGLIKCPKR